MAGRGRWGRAVVAATVGLALVGCGAQGIGQALEQEVTYRTDDVPNVPLDAIRYKRPTFADGDCAWRVTDRQSGTQWWLVRMEAVNGGQWLVLPITGGGGE
jgi:hypothetical protein